MTVVYAIVGFVMGACGYLSYEKTRWKKAQAELWFIEHPPEGGE